MNTAMGVCVFGHQCRQKEIMRTIANKVYCQYGYMEVHYSTAERQHTWRMRIRRMQCQTAVTCLSASVPVPAARVDAARKSNGPTYVIEYGRYKHRRMCVCMYFWSPPVTTRHENEERTRHDELDLDTHRPTGKGMNRTNQ